MGYSLGTATGRIKVDYDGSGVRKATEDLGTYRDATGRLRDEHGKFVKGADAAAAAAGRFGQSTSNMRRGFEQTATAAGAGALVIGGALAFAAIKAIEFEKQISAIGAVSGATGQDLELLRKKALQLGSDTSFSASEAAMAMEELAKAGLSIPDILNGAADAAVALAAAGGVALPEAAELAADAMASFGLKATDMMRVADLIAGAANASSIDVSQFGLSLKAVGAVANLAGISFADTAAAIALMGKMGIKGSDAGTSLKTMLMNLNPVTEKQIGLMKELGIVTADGGNRFFDASGKAKSLSEIAGVLQSSLSGMTKQQQLATLEMLFGSDAIRAAAILADQGSAGFNNMAAAMGKVSAADVAAARLDNAAGAIEQLKGSAETLAITFGSMMLPAIKSAAEFLTSLTNWLNGLDPKWQKFIGMAILAAGALLALIAVIAGIGFAIMGIGAAMAAAPVMGIVVGIVAAIALLALAFKTAWSNSESFRSAVTTTFETLKNGFSKVVSALMPLINYVRNELMPQLANAIQTAWQKFQPALKAISEFMTNRVAPAFDKLSGAIKTAMPTILTVARFLGDVLSNSIQFVGAALGWLIPKLLNIAGPIFSFLVDAISIAISSIKTIGEVIGAVFGFIVGVVSGAINFLSTAWGVISGPVSAVFGLITSIIKLAFSIVTAVISVWWAYISGIFSALFSAVAAPVINAFNFVRNIITSVFNFLKPYISTALSAVVNYFQDKFNQAKNVVSSVWNAISSFISGAVSRIISIVGTIRSIVDMVSNFFGQLRNAASGGVGSLISFVSGIPGRIMGALGGLGSLLYGAGRDVIQGLLNGISNMAGAVIDKARSIANSVRSAIADALSIGSPSRVTMKLGEWTGQGLAIGIQRSQAMVVRAAELAAMATRNAMAALPTDFSGNVRSAVMSSAGQYRAAASGTSAASGSSGKTYQINQTVNAPQNMDPEEVGTAVARKMMLGLAGAGASA